MELAIGDVVETKTGEIMGFDQLIEKLSPASVIYEVWTSPDFPARQALSKILRNIVRQFADTELWICCLRRQQTLRSAIEEAGFQPRRRLAHRAFLHWFRRSSISPPMKIDCRGQVEDSMGASASPMNVPTEGASADCSSSQRNGLAKV